MAISDSTGTARTFVAVGQSGYDRTFVCSNPNTNTRQTLKTKHTISSKSGGINSHLHQMVLEVVDPTLKTTEFVTVNFTIRAPNTMLPGNVNVRDAIVNLVRYLSVQTGTIAATQYLTNIDALVLGADPVP